MRRARGTRYVDQTLKVARGTYDSCRPTSAATPDSLTVPLISASPASADQRSVRSPDRLSSTPSTLWLPASTVAPDSSDVLALIFSLWKTAAVTSARRTSHLTPPSR